MPGQLGDGAPWTFNLSSRDKDAIVGIFGSPTKLWDEKAVSDRRDEKASEVLCREAQGLLLKLRDELQLIEGRIRVLGCSARTVWAARQAGKDCENSISLVGCQIDRTVLNETDFQQKWTRRRLANAESKWKDLEMSLADLGGALQEYREDGYLGEMLVALDDLWRAVILCVWPASLSSVTLLKLRLQQTIECLQNFNGEGLDHIRSRQQDAAAHHINLSQTAAFLASVTATTLQYDSVNAPGPIANAAYSLWYLSLVFAVFSALLSIMGAILAHILIACMTKDFPIGFE